MYQRENVPLFEAIYGPGLISLGGYEAVSCMFTGMYLRGKTLLDIGSGIGGMAHYLATEFGTRVVGLEIHSWMAEYAKQTAPNEIQDQVRFVYYSGSESIPVDSESIDIVYSKGVLTNIADKKPLFEDVKRILRPGGSIVLIDWLTTENEPKTEVLPLGDFSRKETVKSYNNLLKGSGFKDFVFNDVSSEYLEYVKQLDKLLHSKKHKETYANIISEELRVQLIKSNSHLLRQLEEGNQKSFRIKAIAD